MLFLFLIRIKLIKRSQSVRDGIETARDAKGYRQHWSRKSDIKEWPRRPSLHSLPKVLLLQDVLNSLKYPVPRTHEDDLRPVGKYEHEVALQHVVLPELHPQMYEGPPLDEVLHPHLQSITTAVPADSLKYAAPNHPPHED